MKKILPILLLALSGCAQHKEHAFKTPGYEEQSDAEENKDFFYRTWYKPQETTAADRREYRNFFFGSWLRNE